MMWAGKLQTKDTMIQKGVANLFR